MVISLARCGVKVYVLSKTKANLDNLIAEEPSIEPVHQDLSNWEETRETIEGLGEINGLINCAAVCLQPDTAVDIAKDNIDLQLNINLKAAINTMQVVGKQMIQAGKGGTIVNISSVGAGVAIAGLMPYCVSKAGLNMATKGFALEMEPRCEKTGLRGFRPGPTQTRLYSHTR